MALDVVDAGAAEPADRRLQSLGGDVARDDLAAVFHHAGQRQGLAAGAGAPVGHSHARRGTDHGGDQLTALILDFHHTGGERRCQQ